MRIAAKVLGLEKLQKTIGKIEAAGKAALNEGLRKSAIMVHEEAVKSIQGQRSRGREYRRGRKVHIASLPGMPPNTDRGELASGIKWSQNTSRLYALVGTDVKHGAILEDPKGGNRPWLLPALKKVQPKIAKLFLGNTFRNELKK